MDTKGYSMYAGLKDITPCSAVPMSERKFDDIDVKDKNQSILDLIFTIDSVTGFPCGDLSMFMSDKTNAEVKRFISDYLMQEHDVKGFLDLPSDVRQQMKDLDTEFIANMSRKRYESVEDYEARIKQYMEDERESSKRASFLQRLRERYSKNYKMDGNEEDSVD